MKKRTWQPSPTAGDSSQFGLFESKDKIQANVREAERSRYERQVLEALLHPASQPLSATRRSIIRSFVYLYMEPRGYETEAFLTRPLKVFVGKSLVEMLELDHEWKMVYNWMREFRLQPFNECHYLMEEYHPDGKEAV